MSGAEPARRLLARLVDEQAIEIEPIAEIRADLAALGIDPARAIALSRRLAAADSPAASLLRQISASEEGDDDIRRFEQADIGAIRRQLPEGAVAAAAASAHRAAGGVSNVVGIRRRHSRRLLYGLSGVAAAMAASLVFYIGLSNDQAFRRSAAPGAPEPAAQMESRDAAPAQFADRTQSEPERSEGDVAESDSSIAARQQQADESIQSANQPAASGLQSPAAEAESIATPPAAPAPSAPRSDQMGASKMDDDLAKTERAAPADVASQHTGLAAGALSESPAGPLGLGHPVTALLIVDSGLLPAGMRQTEYPSGDLPDRLAEARRVAGDRPIAALVTMQVEGRAVDAIVLASPPAERAKAAPSLAALGPVLPGYELIELGDR